MKYPLYPTNEIDTPTKWSVLHTMRFCEGGTFITDPDLKDYVAKLLELFASYVKYDVNKKHTTWKKVSAVYDVLPLPANIINIIKQSRIDGGHCLVC